MLTTRLDLPAAALTAAAVAGWDEARELLATSPALREQYRETSVDAAANNEYFRLQGESIRRGSHDPRLLAVPEFEQLYADLAEKAQALTGPVLQARVTFSNILCLQTDNSLISRNSYSK